MRTITLEEHYATPAFLDGPGRKREQHVLAAGLQSSLTSSAILAKRELQRWMPQESTCRCCRLPHPRNRAARGNCGDRRCS